MKSRSTASLLVRAIPFNMHRQTPQSARKQTNGQKDGRYQVHYLPAAKSNCIFDFATLLDGQCLIDPLSSCSLRERVNMIHFATW